MKRLLRIPAVLFVLLLGALPVSAVEDIRVAVAAEAFPGDPLGVVVRTDEEISGLVVEILDATGRIILGVKGFRLDEQGWAVSAGLPSTLTPGSYSVRLEVMAGSAASSVQRPLLVKPRVFVLEDIPLSQAMSGLRTDQDPKKDEEARELYRLLLSFNPEAVYHRDAFRSPVGPSRESSFFGDRRTYLYSDGGKAKSIHQGIDFAVVRGTPVLSAGAGKVVLSGPRILTGNTLVLEHLPGVYSLYFHLDGINVKTGDIVEAGTPIGVSGATGLVTGPHLHWEFRAAGVAVDPKKLLLHGFFNLPAAQPTEGFVTSSPNPYQASPSAPQLEPADGYKGKLNMQGLR